MVLAEAEAIINIRIPEVVKLVHPVVRVPMALLSYFGKEA